MRIRQNISYTINIHSLRLLFLCCISMLLVCVMLLSMDNLTKLLAEKFVMYINILSSPQAAISVLGGADISEYIIDGKHLLPSKITEQTSDTTDIMDISKDIVPPIPEEYQAKLVEENFSANYDEALYAKYNNVMVRNYTELSANEIEEVLSDKFESTYTGEQPIVLIYHTHATESYEEYDSNIYDTRNTWRNTDNTKNMVAVGKELADALTELGVKVIHDTTQHDFPSYNGAYNRSREILDKYLKEYPNIAMTLDIHRDGIIREDDTVVKPVLEKNDEKYAQIMVVAPCESSSVNVPNWKENLKFAAALYKEIEEQIAGVCRPIFFDYRQYNLDATKTSLLIEVGSNGNTLEEAKRSARLMAKPIANLLESSFTQR